MKNAWGQTIFCDDLRFEMGGKMSLIGIYQSDMIFHVDLPVIIPKLVIFIKYYEIKGALEDDLLLNVFVPGLEDPAITMAFPRSDIKNLPPPAQPDEDSEAIYHIQIPLTFSPFQILEEGSIKVRMRCGDLITRLGRLLVRKPREGETIFSPTVFPPPSSQSPPGAPAS